MNPPKNIDVLFVAGFGPIPARRDPAASRKFYSQTLGLPFKEDANGYLHTGELDGVKHFALWPLAQAAERSEERREGKRVDLAVGRIGQKDKVRLITRMRDP